MDGEIKLRNYDEFRRKAKALSHIRVTGVGDYSHHFVIISITSTTEELDAVTVGQYTSSGEIFTENSKGIGKFVRQTILLGQNTPNIFDFERGLYLIKKRNYPNTEDESTKAYDRLDEMIDERRYEISSNNCEHSINYILTGKSTSSQSDQGKCGKRCLIDLCDVVIMDCKDVGLKVALIIAALGAIAGSLVRRAYVRIIIAAIVSHTVGKEVGNCGKMIGTNIREEAQRRIDLAKNDYDINAVITKENKTILNDMEDHLNTIFVCEMAENLIYDAAYMTCGAAMVVSVGFETIFFLSYVCFSLIPRRSRNRIGKKKYCRILFMRLFGGYGSIVITIIFGFFIFLNVDRPAIAFFGFVFVIGILLRYALTLIAGFSFDCCCSYWRDRCDLSCCSCWGGCCDVSWYKRYGFCCQVSVVITVLLILVGIICSLFYFLDL
jgi:hypothetical protein